MSEPETGGEFAPTRSVRSHEATHAADRMRRSSFGQLILLIVQFGLGMWVNLFVTLPADDANQGLGKSFGNAMKGPILVAVHAGFGALVFLNALVLVVFALTVRQGTVKACTVLALLCIASAAFSGAAVVNALPNDGNHASFAMTVFALVAMACYAINLVVLGGDKARHAAAPIA